MTDKLSDDLQKAISKVFAENGYDVSMHFDFVTGWGSVAMRIDLAGKKSPIDPYLLVYVDISQGEQLDRIAADYGLSRHQKICDKGDGAGIRCHIETDVDFRARIIHHIKGGSLDNYKPATPEEAPHKDHEIVENYAGGKPFRYCRNCKVEVP